MMINFDHYKNMRYEKKNKKTSHFPLYWLFNKDPYNGLL